MTELDGLIEMTPDWTQVHVAPTYVGSDYFEFYVRNIYMIFL
jgi:hypothetical protein